MPTTKTAISLDTELFTRAESVAQELDISRSRLFALAIDQFIDRHTNQQLLDRLDRVHAESTSPEDTEARARRRAHRQQVEGTW